MGKPTGFMEYQRKTGNTVAPLERIKNFKEFHLQLPKKEQQDARLPAVWHAVYRSARREP